MNRFIQTTVVALSMLLLSSNAHGAIIKLGFSTDTKPDVEVAGGTLSTVIDVSAGTLGDQDTEVTLLGVLAGLVTIEGDRASFTLDGVQLIGNPAQIAGTLLQPTDGGTFKLYDPANNVLLEGTLGKGTLSGPLGGTATGGFLTTEFGQFTGGSLYGTLVAHQMLRSSISISMTDVGDGEGFGLNPNGSLKEFVADATASISAQEPVPEPQTFALAIGAFATLFLGLRARA